MMKRIQWLYLSVLTGMVFFTGAVNAQVTSVLWGVNGDAWNTNGILRDFTHVGYKGGGAEHIPGTNDWTNAVSVLDYGAIPDDFLDDSDAFIAAISNCPDYSAVFVPKGQYIITKKIRPQRSHFVLRGEDMYKTVLFYPKYISEIDIREVGLPDVLTSINRSPITGEAFFEMVGGEEKSIENLTLEFREQRKGGIWEYRGANFIRFEDAMNSWVRNVHIKNFDIGIGVLGDYISIVNIIADQYNGRQGVDGAISGKLDAFSTLLPRNSTHNLYHNIDITGHLLQPVDNNDSSRHSVYSKISTGEMNNRVVGLHGGSSQHHLYTELNHPVIRGADDPGTETSWSNCTYWGVNGELTQDTYENADNSCIYVGFGDDWSIKANATFYYEPATYGQLAPTNLYLAQLEYFNKPLPEGLPAPLPKPYEVDGDVVRMPAADDMTPGGDPTGKLDAGGSYLRFDLSAASFPAVAHARLRLTLDGVANPPFKLSAWMVADDSWSEDTLTVENQPDPGSELDSKWILEDEKNCTVEFDVTEFVRDQLVDGDGVVSLYVNRPEGSGNSFWSSEVGPHPELIIERTASSVAGAPRAPKGIGSTPLVGNIVLDWDDNPESDVATYTVYRSPHSYGLLPIAAGLVTSDHVDVNSIKDWRPGQMDHKQVYHYWITAVDEHGYESPFSREFVAAVVHPSNAPPAFSEAANLSDAITGVDYTDHLADEASDPEDDRMYFMKVSGPDWLNVALDGTLSGTADTEDIGTNQFVFQVTAIGGSTQKVVNIQVNLPADDPPGAPAAPTNLVATVDYNTVRLEWDDNTEADLAGYTIYRSLTSDVYGDAMATNSPLSSAYVDSTAVNGTTYYYVVEAFDSNLNVSEKSNEISATPVDAAPAAPTGLAAAAGDNEVRLVWNANIESDLAGYSVYRSTASGNYSGTALASNIATSSYVDSTAVNGTTYYYVVTAVDVSSNESAVSSEVSATPVEPDVKVVAYYPFNSSSMASVDTETNSVAGDMVVSAGVTTFKWETRAFWVQPPASQPAAAFDAGTDFVDGTVLDDDYFSFTITPLNGVMLDFATLSFVDRSGGFSVSAASDQDDFATVLDSIAAAGSWTTNTLDLSFLSSTADPIELRLYFHDGSSNDRMIDNVEISATVIAEPPLSGYDLWAAGWSNSIGSATNDFDTDGMNNLGEYALGGDPTSALVRGSMPTLSPFGSGFIYVYPQRADDHTLTYRVETTTNLVSGGWTNVGYTVTGTNVTGGTLNFVTNAVDFFGNEVFIRLKVAQ